MAKQRKTQTYVLYDGSKKVYIGTTDNLERREREHRGEEKQFTRIKPTSRRMTDDGAKKQEAKQLEAYRRGHSGDNPTYNEDSDE